jgi:hypothetical protein
VPEVSLHLLEVPARGDEQRRARVAQIVEAHAEQLGRLDGRRVLATTKVVMMDGAVLSSREDPTVG